MSNKTSIYLGAEMRRMLRVPPRGPSAAVSATIERYDALLAPERKRLEALFDEGEWNAMRNASASTAWGAKEQQRAIRDGVLHQIQDSLDDEITSYGADRATLEGKLAALTVVQQYALVEMLETYWEAQGPAVTDPED